VKLLKKPLILSLIPFFSFLLISVEAETFSHSVKTEKKPWTSKSFLNDPSDFQFAIVSDRTGGVREGVFPQAVDKINELRPEFVITVGDMIKGGAGNRNVGKLMGEWEEFNSFIKGFDMPFFYLPGNHDVGNEVADEIWDELYGVRYYSFVYKDVLFLCLNTQGGPGSKPALLEEEQIQWALNELRKNQQVRWTIVFMHQPLWLIEEGILIRKNGNKELRRTDTGWPRVAKELKKRRHTVFAGHVHHYGKYLRNKTSFYTLGTTGGGSKLRGEAFGEFDHATWVTMTDEGPRMANLLIDGIMKDDVTKESHQIFWRSLVFEEYFKKGSVLDGKELTLILKNPFEFKIGGRLSWIQPAHKNVEVDPMSSNVSLLAGKEEILKFKLQGIGESKKRGFKSLPKLEVRFKSEGNSFDFEMLMDVPIEK
jgi:Icc-related predicted phosphoesterase